MAMQSAGAFVIVSLTLGSKNNNPKIVSHTLALGMIMKTILVLKPFEKK